MNKPIGMPYRFSKETDEEYSKRTGVSLEDARKLRERTEAKKNNGDV
jgi:hypothetical protein